MPALLRILMNDSKSNQSEPALDEVQTKQTSRPTVNR
jgi:hypothetical protein